MFCDIKYDFIFQIRARFHPKCVELRTSCTREGGVTSHVYVRNSQAINVSLLRFEETVANEQNQNKGGREMVGRGRGYEID